MKRFYTNATYKFKQNEHCIPMGTDDIHQDEFQFMKHALGSIHNYPFHIMYNAYAY